MGCGYNLQGNVTGICPECGASIELVPIRFGPPRLWPLCVAFTVAWCVSFPSIDGIRTRLVRDGSTTQAVVDALGEPESREVMKWGPIARLRNYITDSSYAETWHYRWSHLGRSLECEIRITDLGYVWSVRHNGIEPHSVGVFWLALGVSGVLIYGVRGIVIQRRSKGARNA